MSLKDAVYADAPNRASPTSHPLTTSSSSSKPSNEEPKLFGLPLKYVSLVTLAVQNATLAIMMHYSRVSTAPGETYSAASAVLLNELLKGSISMVIALMRIDPDDRRRSSVTAPPASPVGKEYSLLTKTTRRAGSAVPSIVRRPVSRFRKLGKEVFSADCWKLSIPAILYVIQNNLQFVAASNLDVATFQVTYQMKILTTAAFSVVLLRKRLSTVKWLSLLGLAVGVGIVQIQTGAASGTGAAHHGSEMSPLKGFLAVSAACMTSGLAGVYFEMVLKGSQSDLWVRNVQLSLFSLLPALVPVLFNGSAPGGGWFPWHLFQNFGFWAWATVLIQVFGGLVTAVVIKYSDNIMKGFATSLSIIISFLASVALFNFSITVPFVVGSSVVLAATWFYNQPAPPPSAPAHPHEKGSDSLSISLSSLGVVRRPSNVPGSPIEPNAPILGQPGKSKKSPLPTPMGIVSAIKDAVLSRPPSPETQQQHGRFGSGEYFPGRVNGTPINRSASASSANLLASGPPSRNGSTIGLGGPLSMTSPSSKELPAGGSKYI